jgi:gluconokinase
MKAVVVMGVSGCGKTSVAAALAAKRAWVFADADDFHPAANVAKMRAGEPLTDDDRRPWLQALNAFLTAQTNTTVLACSALKKSYRDIIANHLPVRWVHLAGSFETISDRLQARQGHYMPASLLHSQFATLEAPSSEDALILDIKLPVLELMLCIEKDLYALAQ